MKTHCLTITPMLLFLFFTTCFGMEKAQDEQRGAHSHATLSTPQEFYGQDLGFKCLAEPDELLQAYFDQEKELISPLLNGCKHVVNIGCGVGNFIKRNQAEGRTFVGIDNSENLLAEARKQFADNPLITFHHADACNLPKELINSGNTTVFDFSTFNMLPKQSHILETLKSYGTQQIIISIWQNTKDVTVKRIEHYNATGTPVIDQSEYHLTLSLPGNKTWTIPIYSSKDCEKLLKDAGYEVTSHFSDLVQIIEGKKA